MVLAIFIGMFSFSVFVLRGRHTHTFVVSVLQMYNIANCMFNRPYLTPLV